jgi:uroporphyrinogen decarboxylase
MNAHTRLGNALRGLPTDRPPIWFMRQAGRYLPEYRAIRQRVSFLELCADSDLSCEVTIQPVDRFGVDAAIVFSDILTVPEAVGMEVVFDLGHGPRLPSPLRSASDVDKLVRPDVTAARSLQTVPETLKKFRAQRPDTPILGFAGAPYTLLSYMCEGKGSDDWIETKKLLMSDPATAQRALDLLADVVGDYLQLQIDSGAAGVQIFDTWAGALSVEDYKRFALPATARALARVKGAPRLHFTRDTMPFLHLVKQTGADAVALDWRADMAHVRSLLGEMPVQGNLDPIALFGPPEHIRARVHQICDAAGPVGHVFNLGHGIQPSTPIEGVEAMVAAVKERASRA